MLYIEDREKKVIREYYTSEKVEKAIETLLRQDDHVSFSESHPGLTITYRKLEGDE